MGKKRNNQFEWRAACRIHRAWGLAAVAFMLLLPGCARYYVFPAVKITTQTTSSPIVLEVINQLSERLVVKPVGDDVKDLEIAPGATATVATLVVAELRFGDSSAVTGTQALEGAYLDPGAAGFAQITMNADAENCPECVACGIRISTVHNDWFNTDRVRVSGPDPELPKLTVCVAECDAGRVTFAHGPKTDECP